MNIDDGKLEKIVEGICEIVIKTLRNELTLLVEKLTVTQSRDIIIRNMLQSLPEYKELVEENRKFKALHEEVHIVIREKCVVNTALPKEDNKLIANYDIQNRLDDWSNKFEEFIDNIDQDDPIIESINLLKEDFDGNFSFYFKNKRASNIITNIINVSEDGTESDIESEYNLQLADLDNCKPEPESEPKQSSFSIHTTQEL